MSDLVKSLFQWLGISYTVLIVGGLIFWAVKYFYDRWEVRIRHRLSRENHELKKRIRELESRFETEPEE